MIGFSKIQQILHFLQIFADSLKIFRFFAKCVKFKILPNFYHFSMKFPPNFIGIIIQLREIPDNCRRFLTQGEEFRKMSTIFRFFDTEKCILREFLTLGVRFWNISTLEVWEFLPSPALDRRRIAAECAPTVPHHLASCTASLRCVCDTGSSGESTSNFRQILAKFS